MIYITPGERTITSQATHPSNTSGMAQPALNRPWIANTQPGGEITHRMNVTNM